MTPVQTTLAFVARINAHDVDGLAALLTEDHLFIDPGGETVRGRQAMTEAWRAYFRMIPDYRIVISSEAANGATVALTGQAGGTYSRDGTLHQSGQWEVPAAWRAVIRDEQVAEWQVYADNEPLRRILHRPRL